MIWLIVIGGVIAGCLIAVGVTALVDLVLARKFDDSDDDRAGVKIGAAYAIYGIIIGMAVVSAQGTYDDAQQSLRLEAGTIISSYQIAQALPDEEGKPVLEAFNAYVVADLASWPSLASGDVDLTVPIAMRAVYDAVQSLSAYDDASNAQSTLMSALQTIDQSRANRTFDAQKRLPGLLWALLIVGGIVVIAMAAFLRFKDWRLRFGMILATSVLIALGLITIWALSNPYSSTTGISTTPMDYVKELANHPSAS